MDRGGGLAGLSEQEAARRLAARGRVGPRRSSRSYTSIVRANVLTVFNAILAGFGGLTLAFGDWRDALFLGVIVVNSGIGITQEIRAKRALDRLSLLVAPHARVNRDGSVRAVAVEEVVVGDVALLEPGDQVTADGHLLAASELRLDESILTGESQPVPCVVGDYVRSGAFVLEGTGAYQVSAVGVDSFAERVTGQARSFRHPRSPLERAVNRLLYVLVALVIGLGALLAYSLHHRHVHLHTAVATSTAGVVSMIPEGLMVLVSLTYAAGAVRMSRRGVLAQQLNAIESMDSVDTICIDKTGTLTDAALRVVEVLPAPGMGEDRLRAWLGELAASATARNITLQAIADACPAEAQPVLGEVPSPAAVAGARCRSPAAPSTSGRRDGSHSARLPRRVRSVSAKAGACLRSPEGTVRCPIRPTSIRPRISSLWGWSCSPRNCVRTSARRSPFSNMRVSRSRCCPATRHRRLQR